MEYGETISRTGYMMVQCDAAFDVSQNGIEWTPIGLVDGAVEYVLSSNGRVSIKVDGREVFFFTVSFTPDYLPGSTSYGAFTGEENEILYSQRYGNAYFQAPFVDGTVRFISYINGVNAAEVSTLESYSSRGTMSVQIAADNSVLVSIREIGSFDEPLIVKLGNVLVAFCEPMA